MGLLGLRKFIDSCGCTRLLPVPVSDAEAAEEALRRLRTEGYCEVAEEDGEGGVHYEEDRRGTSGKEKRDRQRRLTSSLHVNGASPTAAAAAAAAAVPGRVTPVADHVLVDMNCIVHSCFHHQGSENKTKKQLIQEVLERLRVLLTEVVIPRQSLSICFDGPAPIAKLQTQRLRRRKVSLLDTGSTQQLNTLSITAGSLFMIELENAIASQFKLNHGRGFLRRMCPVYLYGTTMMGEGEAKISRALAFLAYGPTAAATKTAAGGLHHSEDDGDYRDGVAGRASHRRGNSNGNNSGRHVNGRASAASSSAAATSLAPSSRSFAHYHPDDSIVVLGNDIDLVVTCLGATAYHNFSIISPSSLQLIRVSDIIYRWLKATSATRGDTPFSPAQLPSIRIDFVYLFLLNGGDHYVGAGEVAMSLWRRYRSVRAAYPYSTLVSPNLDAIDIDFLADVVQASEYTGSSSVEVGLNLLQSALWSLYTVVTGVCPDYNFVPAPEAPQLCHLRAAAAHCQRTNRRIRLPDFKAESQPLTPLETYVALMPTEATLPRSVVAGLHRKLAYQSILKTLETSNDAATIAQAAKDAVEVSAPFLTTSEQYLRHFTSPVQLNVIPPRRRLSRYEQHRMLATQGHTRVDDSVPVVKSIAMAEEVPYMEVPYPAHTSFLDFYCPLDACTDSSETAGAYGAGQEGEDPESGNQNGASSFNKNSTHTVTHVQGRAVSSRPSLYATAVAVGAAAAASPPPLGGSGGGPHRTNSSRHGGGSTADTVEHKRVYLFQEEAAQAQQDRERQSAASKLQRTLSATSHLLQQGRHLTAPQERRMRRRLQRLQSAEKAELQAKIAREERQYAAREGGNGGADAADLEAELRRFLGDHATSSDVAALLQTTQAESDGGAATLRKMKHKKVKSSKEASKKEKKRSAGKISDAEAQVVGHISTGKVKKAKKREREEELTHDGNTAKHDTALRMPNEALSRPRSVESRVHSRPAKKHKK